MNEEGFTYIEVVVSIFLLSLLSLLLYTAINAAYIGGEKGLSLAKETTDLARFERSLRQIVMEIPTPWWGTTRAPIERDIFDELINQYDDFEFKSIREYENYLEFTLTVKKDHEYTISASYGSFSLLGGDDE